MLKFSAWIFTSDQVSPAEESVQYPYVRIVFPVIESRPLHDYVAQRLRWLRKFVSSMAILSRIG